MPTTDKNSRGRDRSTREKCTSTTPAGPLSARTERPDQGVPLAHFVLTRAWGGLEMAAVEYARRLTLLGHPGVVFTLEGSPAQKRAEHLGIQTVTVAKSRYFAPAQSLKIRQALNKHQIRGILVHHLRDLWVLRPALIGLPDRSVVGFAHMFLSGINKKDVLHRWLYSRLKCLITMTEVQRTELLKCIPVLPEKVVLLPNGTDLDHFSPKKRSDDGRARIFGATPDHKLIGVVGRLDPQKGQLEFLQSFKILTERRNDVRAALVGRPNADGHAYKDQLIAFVKNNGLEDKVCFLENLADVSEAFACLDLFVMPSYLESFGLVLVEAMASGVPVLATRAGGPIDILNDGEFGSLVPPRDPPAMAREMESILNHPTEIKARVERALAVARERYELKSILRQIQNLVSAN